MAIQQTLVGLGNNPKFVGQTMTSERVVENITFEYPSGYAGDTLVVFAVADNLTVPELPADWNTIYSNTTTAVNGSGSGRLLAYKKRGIDESNSTVFVSGGGNINCVALRGFNQQFSNVTEWVANSSISVVANTTVKSRQIWVAMFNQDGAIANAVIDITNTTATFARSNNDTRSTTIGYLQNTYTTISKSNYFTIDAENAYGMTFLVT